MVPSPEIVKSTPKAEQETIKEVITETTKVEEKSSPKAVETHKLIETQNISETKNLTSEEIKNKFPRFINEAIEEHSSLKTLANCSVSFMNGCINFHTTINFVLSELERSKETILEQIAKHISSSVKANFILEDDLSKFTECLSFLNIREESNQSQEIKPLTKIQFMEIDTSKSNEIEKYLIDQLGAKRIS